MAFVTMKWLVVMVLILLLLFAYRKQTNVSDNSHYFTHRNGLEMRQSLTHAPSIKPGSDLALVGGVRVIR